MNLGVMSIGLMVGWILTLAAFMIAVEITEQKFYKQIFHFDISNSLSKKIKSSTFKKFTKLILFLKTGITSDRVENRAQIMVSKVDLIR